MNKLVYKSILLCVTIVLSLQSGIAYAQRVFMGNAYKQDGFVYEDRILDDGTRFIMSGMWDVGEFSFSLCLFNSEDGDYWYGLAIESKEYIPRNGLLVFVPASESGRPIVLGQSHSDNTTITYSRTRINPSFIFWGGGRSSIALTSFLTVDSKDVSFAIYDLPEDILKSLIKEGIADMRLSSRSTYYELKPWAAKSMPRWLEYSKSYVDSRAEKSVNCILEDLID